MLGVLCVVIVGLGVGLVVNHLLKNLNDDGLSQAEIAYDTGIELINSENGQSEDAMIYFDERIAETLDSDEKFMLQSVRINVLIQSGFFDEALGYLDEFNTEELSDIQLCDVYVAYEVVYDNLGDSDKSEYYGDLLQEISNELNEELFDE